MPSPLGVKCGGVEKSEDRPPKREVCSRMFMIPQKQKIKPSPSNVPAHRTLKTSATPPRKKKRAKERRGWTEQNHTNTYNTVKDTKLPKGYPDIGGYPLWPTGTERNPPEGISPNRRRVLGCCVEEKCPDLQETPLTVRHIKNKKCKTAVGRVSGVR